MTKNGVVSEWIRVFKLWFCGMKYSLFSKRNHIGKTGGIQCMALECKTPSITFPSSLRPAISNTYYIVARNSSITRSFYLSPPGARYVLYHRNVAGLPQPDSRWEPVGRAAVVGGGKDDQLRVSHSPKQDRRPLVQWPYAVSSVSIHTEVLQSEHTEPGGLQSLPVITFAFWM